MSDLAHVKEAAVKLGREGQYLSMNVWRVIASEQTPDDMAVFVNARWDEFKSYVATVQAEHPQITYEQHLGLCMQERTDARFRDVPVWFCPYCIHIVPMFTTRGPRHQNIFDPSYGVCSDCIVEAGYMSEDDMDEFVQGWGADEIDYRAIVNKFKKAREPKPVQLEVFNL